MATTIVRLSYGQNVRAIALYPGLDVDEIQMLLRSAFSISGTAIGFLAENGLIIPLSLACRSPEVCPGSICKLLIKGESESNAAPAVSAPQQRSRLEVNVGDRENRTIRNEDQTSQGKSNDRAVTEAALNAILKFIGDLRKERAISVTDAKLLEELLFENSTLLVAAYSVAISAGDKEYLADIFRDIADSLSSDVGRSVCEAQEEVLQTCDQLYLANKITENQLLYLRHLVLIRDESVAAIYDKYQDAGAEGSIAELARNLYYLVNNTASVSTKSNTSTATQISPDEMDDDEDEDEDTSESRRQHDSDRAIMNAIRNDRPSLTTIATAMIKNKELSPAEGAVLVQCVKAKNQYILAAYELFTEDGNTSEFKDTLKRCIALEIRRAAAIQKEEELKQRQQTTNAATANLRRQLDLEEELVRRKEAQNNEDDDEEDDDEDSDDENVDVESLLRYFNINSSWDPADVPRSFVSAVFKGAYLTYISAGEARALCDLFQARYDLVVAAWEVYAVQKDHRDFIDTCKRIVRDLSFDDQGNLQYEDDEDDEDEQEVEEDPEDDDEEQYQQAVKSSATQASQNLQKAIDQNQSERERILANKREAMEAIRNAKLDLLKHSLEMMVKQGIIKSESVAILIKRAEKGNALIDAAIDTYAADRNVAEFLDTLQILCNHSEEELDAIIKSAASRSVAEATPTASAAPAPAPAAESVPASKQSPAKAQPSLAERTTSANAEIQALENLRDLSQILIELAKASVLPAARATVLLNLVRNRDQRLLAAYEVLKENHDFDEFVDSLVRIASVSEATSSSSTAAPASAETAAKTGSPQRSSPAKPAAPSASASASAGQVLSKTDYKQVIGILQNASAISPAHSAQLSRLIDSDDQRIGVIFAEYEAKRDAHVLINHLKALVAQTEAENDDDEDEEEEEEESEEEEDDDDEEDEAATEPLGRVSIEERFMKIIQEMDLSHLETAALRLAIARDDPMIRGALDAFRFDLNEKKLSDALRLVSRKTISSTMSSDDDEEEEDEGDNDDEEEEDEVEEDDDSEYENAAKEAVLRVARAAAANNRNDNDEDEEEDEEDDDEEDEEDDEDDAGEGERDEKESYLSSQAARERVFPLLVGELLKENIISASDEAVLLRLFQEGSPVINGALDVYDLDHDMSDLVDTLQSAVASAESN